MADLQQARDAKARLRTSLARHPGISGVGLTRVRDGYCLQVNLEHATDDDIPRWVDGVPVHVRVVGPVRAGA